MDVGPDALSWLRLLVTGTVACDEEAGRVAIAAGWAQRTRRRNVAELVSEHTLAVEDRLDRTWPDWRDAREALAAADLPPTVRGWRQLCDRVRREVPRHLPDQLNAHTVAAWLRGDAKAGLGAAERAAVGATVVTHDNILRLRPHDGIVLERGGARLDGNTLRAFTNEIVLPERAVFDGLRLVGRAPEVLLLIENIGVYLDLPLPPAWCAASVPGWNLAMLQVLRGLWPSAPAVLFGDLDPAGVAIAATCRLQWPELRWFVPAWSDTLLAVSRPRTWPALAEGVPDTIRRLAEAGRWVEQEQLVHMPGLKREIFGVVRGIG